MSTLSTKCSLLRSSALLGALFFTATAGSVCAFPLQPSTSSLPGTSSDQDTSTATPAAQTATPPSSGTSKSDDQPQVIIVTGSKIKRVDAETASPVQVVSKIELERSGYSTINDVLQQVSANGAGTLSANNSEAFAGGASGVAMRGLSVGATLTLVDGHRLAPYPLSDDGERQFTDTQSIPFDAVERVEVLKDGASAIYGSDAIAGVVNIILKKSIVGVDAVAEEGVAQHGGGTTSHLAFSAGQGDVDLNGYNVYVAAEYRNEQSIYLRDRQYEAWGSQDYSALGGNNLTPGAPNAFNGGLPATLTPYFYNPAKSQSDPTAYQFLNSNCKYAKMIASQCTYANPTKELSPNQKASIITSLTKKFNDDWSMNIKASVFDSKGQQTLAGFSPNPGYFGYNSFPGASFAGGITNPVGGVAQLNTGAISDYSIPNGVAGNTTGGNADLYGVIPGIGMPTINTNSMTYRLAADIDGKIGTWDVGASLGLSKVDTQISFVNFVNYDNLYSALTSTSNPFSLTGNNSAAMLAFVAPTSTYHATDVLNYVDLHATGQLFELPGGPLSMATGFSITEKELNNPGDPAVLAAQIVGTFSTYAIGNQTDTAAYVELDGKPLKSLEVNAALRDDYYDTYGNSLTPKLGFKWRPSDMFALRGTYSEGFRAPSPAEIGTSATLFGLGLTFPDPVLCGTDNGQAKGQVPASCATVPGFIQTTNPLKPEQSKSETLGMIFEPIKGWSSTLDYYNIQIDHQIITAAELSDYTLANCLRGEALATSGVSDGNGNLVTAVPNAGPITLCYSGYVNADKTATSGLDFQTNYKWRLFGGSLFASFDATYELKYDLTANGTTYKLAGTHGPSGVSGDTGNPRDREQFELAYTRGPWNVAFEGYRIGRYSVVDPSAIGGIDSTCQSALLNSTLDFATQASAPSQFCNVKAFTSVNMTASYRITPKLTAKLVVDNLFDANAPEDFQTYGGSFIANNPSLHEDGIIGRFFTIGFNYQY